MKKHTSKRHGLAMEIKTFKGDSGKSYLVFRTLKGGYHVFAEVEAKEAAKDCGTTIKTGTSREMWKEVWDSWRVIKRPLSTPVGPAPAKKSLLDVIKAKKATAKT